MRLTKKKNCSVCNNPDWNDLEDGLQMKCAETEELDYIITRDEKKWIQEFSCKNYKTCGFLENQEIKPNKAPKPNGGQNSRKF